MIKPICIGKPVDNVHENIDIYSKTLKLGNGTTINSGYIDSSQLVYTFSPEAYDSYVALKKEREYNDYG